MNQVLGSVARRSIGQGALVGLSAALVHIRSIAFDYTYLDDRDFIVEDQPFLVQPASVLRAFTRSYMGVIDGQHPYYRPLITVSYVIDAQWSGLRAFGYHATNVALHVAASVLFFALLRRVAFGCIITFVAALVFAVHPVLASAVAWIPGRNDLLLGVFALASWLTFLHQASHRSARYCVLHLGFFWLSLLTKESAVVIPLVCLAHLAVLEPGAFTRFGRSGATLAVIGGWIVGITGRFLVHPVTPIETVRGIMHKVALLVTSLGQLTLPVNPSLLTVREDLSLWPGVLAAGLVAAVALWAPGVRRRVVVLGAITFALCLGPAIAAPGDLVLNSRLYLPACGAIIAIAEIVRALPCERAALASFSGTTVVALAAMALAYGGTFRDRRTFARSAVAAAPHSPIAHFCLAQTYQLDGDIGPALTEYRMALSLGAEFVVHNNIAVIHMGAARWLEAEQELRDELEIDPRYVRAYRNLGIVLRREGRTAEASLAEERAQKLTGDAAEAP